MGSPIKPLVLLSRQLSGPRRDGALCDALDLLLAAAGCSRGAVYLSRGETLELAADAGMPAELREPLKRLPPWTAPWFVAQRAAQDRALLIDREVALRSGERLDRALLTDAGWAQIAACPIHAGAEVLGVALVAAPTEEDLEAEAAGALELACAIFGRYLAQPGAGPRSVDPRSADPRSADLRTAPTELALAVTVPPEPGTHIPTLPGPPPIRLSAPLPAPPRVPVISGARPLDADEIARETPLPPTPVTHGMPFGNRVPTRSETPPPLAARSSASQKIVGAGRYEEIAPSTAAQSRRDRELASAASSIAERLRSEGPKRGAAVLTMLRDGGLGEPEALSVITFALSTGVIERDPSVSTLLRASEPPLPRTVLLVDDDAELRAILSEVLADQGYAVETAENGSVALERLRGSDPPSVVVLDLMMPVMDGYQFLDQVKQDPALSQIPVIVISAGRRAPRAPRGADGFLSKPVDFYELVTSIERSSKGRTTVNDTR